jgi:hypothetical protein
LKIDTFEKFKELQKRLSQERGQLVYLDEQRKRLQDVADLARKVREAERERGRAVDEIKAMVSRSTPVYERFSSSRPFVAKSRRAAANRRNALQRNPPTIGRRAWAPLWPRRPANSDLANKCDVVTISHS